LECAFFQSEIYTLDEKKCEQEITQQKIELIKLGRTVQAICVDIKILEKKSDVTYRSFPSW
jgi:hypothetical protein